jgi:NADPH:quinone reductase
VVFDSVGGPHLEQLIEVTARYGTIIYFGMSDPTNPIPLPLGKLFLKNLSIRAFALYLWEKPERTEQAIAFIREGVKRGVLKPIISRVFVFPDILEAAKYFDSMQQAGKVVISVSRGPR